MCVPETDGSDQLMNDGGEATLLMNNGNELEEKNAKDGYLPDPVSTNNAKFNEPPVAEGLDPRVASRRS